MADFSVDVDKILSQISNTDLGKQMLDILKATGMPKIESDKNLGNSTMGEYTPATNSIDLSWQLSPKVSRSDPNAAVSTLAHELQHAVDAVSLIDNVTPEARKELLKFYNTKTSEPLRKLIQKAGGGDYRQQGSERSAFGTGNFVGYAVGAAGTNPVSHVDATAAQENAIKMDLLLRSLQRKSK